MCYSHRVQAAPWNGAVQHVKGGSARKIGQLLNLRFPVWQRGFSDHTIRDVKDYEAHVRYIEQNPVKRKLVPAAIEYPWSSLGRRFDLDVPPQGLKSLCENSS